MRELLQQQMRVAQKAHSESAAPLDEAWQIYRGEIKFDKTEPDEDGNTSRVELGKGSFGTVYKGLHRGRAAAIKEIALQSADDVQSFRQEAILMARLRHPNIVTFYGGALETGHRRVGYLVAELLKCTLAEAIYNPQTHNLRLSDVERLRITAQIAQGMLYLHTAQPTVVHHDLKPQNIMLTAKAEVRIVDFGLAKVKSSVASSASRAVHRGTIW